MFHLFANTIALKWAFYILLVLAILLIIFTVFYRPLFKSIVGKHYLNIYGRKVYQVAQNYDYYLINNFSYRLADGTSFKIDHILFGNKYIYVIKDMFCDGGLSAKADDNSWIRYYKEKKELVKKLIRNPLKDNEILVSKLAKVTAIDESLFIGIVIVNNDCQISEYDPTKDNSYLSKPRYIERLVQEIEARNIKPINATQLHGAVQDIAKLNYKNEQRN